MNDLLKDHKFLLIGAGAALVAVLILTKKKGAATDVGTALGTAAANLATGAAAGVVYGVGDAVGIPRTNMNECEKAIAEGRTWDASFACSAGTFIDYVTH
jgi:hypothetical protein